jgi:hypothetical protein
VADGTDERVLERRAKFRGLTRAPGHRQTLLAPEAAADAGEGVAEGWPALAVPGTTRRGQALRGAEARRQQGDGTVNFLGFRRSRWPTDGSDHMTLNPWQQPR